MLVKAITLAALMLCTAACSGSNDDDSAITDEHAPGLDALAEEYVHVALAFREYDEDYVDAYYGPPEWLQQAEREAATLSELRARAGRALEAVAELPSGPQGVEAQRRNMLEKRLRSMLLRIDMADSERKGSLPKFDEETRVLFDAVAPDYDAAHFEQIIERVAAIVPGEGPLAARVEAFRRRFEIPKDRLSAVFDAAVAECRRRTFAHVALPENERFTVEYVTNKPWSGYNWYKGGYFSVIQVNTDLPIFVDRAVDLGCHEAYPGHHTQNVLRERDLVAGRGWIEFTIVPLYGPQSPLEEGGANYGILLAFPDDERAAFERDVLFPLAGLDPSTAAAYEQLNELLRELRFANNEAARDYLDGAVTRQQAVDWLVSYGLTSVERAEQGVRFIENYRSYVINYNVGRDLVKGYIEREAGADVDRRWSEYVHLYSAPFTAGELARR